MSSENIVRTTMKRILSFFKKRGFSNIVLGLYYTTIHWILMALGVFVTLFNNDPWHLTIVLILITLDGLANFAVHDCPLTILEQKYLGTNLMKERKNTLKKANILYKCNHIYESQIEILVNLWTFIACKILFLIAMKSVNITLSTAGP